MSKVLYRKYRPKNFSELIGQNPIRVTLENEIESGKIAHAYLFSGPRGVGKTTTARLFARAINCTKKKGAEPCGTCQSCTTIMDGKSFDLHEIDAASHTGVDNVRENIIENARFTPQQATYKVYIIDEVHMLSASAFNVLLKTLEEPPEHVIFILATTEVHRVPETIISRCQRFDFKRVSVADLVNRLELLSKAEKVSVDLTILQNIARRAEGSVRDAEVLLGQIMAIGGKKISEEEAALVMPRSNLTTVVELLFSLLTKNAQSGIALVNKLVDEGVNILDFTKDFIEFLRTVLLATIQESTQDLESLELDEETMRELKSKLQSVSVIELVTMIEVIISKTKDLRYAQIIQLPLELAILDICGEQNNKTPDTPHSTPPTSTVISGTKAGAAEEATPPKAMTTGVKKATVKGSTSFKKLLTAWQSIVKRLRDENHSLGLSLKVGVPVQIEGNTLAIGFNYAFHADRIRDRESRTIIEDIIKDEIGSRLSMKVMQLSTQEYEEYVKENMRSDKKSESEETLKQALHVFAGEVTEEEI